MISMIAAIGKNRELGKNGQLIFHIKADMHFFRDTTMGHPVVMGRKTWESIGRKLPGRTNIVISSGDVPGADRVIHDLPTFITECQHSDTEIFIIGGASIYAAFLDSADCLYLTEIDASAPDADAFFPSFDRAQFSRQRVKKGKENDLAYTISKYIRK